MENLIQSSSARFSGGTHQRLRSEPIQLEVGGFANGYAKATPKSNFNSQPKLTIKNGEQFKPDFILSKVICMEEQEKQAEKEQINRLKLHFGIVDKAVDRMIDLVLSQQEHIKNLQLTIDHYQQLCENNQNAWLGQSIELRSL